MDATRSVEANISAAGRLRRRFRAPFHLPHRPRFLHELVVVQLQDKMLVDGAERLHVFEGRGAREVLSTLVPLLDGTRTLEEIENALPEVSSDEIAEAVSFLCESRLVEDDALARAPDFARNPETLAFFRRYAGAIGVNRDGLEAWEKLCASEVLIVDSSSPHEQTVLRTALLTTGVRVSSLDRKSLGLWRPGAHRNSLILSVSWGAEDREWHAKLDEWCSKNQASWLRAALDVKSGYAELGPVFHSREGACYGCFSRVHSQPSSGPGPLHAVLPAQVQFFISLIAVEVIYLLTQIGPPLKGRDFRRYALPEWQPQDLCWPRVPGCPRCLPIMDRAAAQGAAADEQRFMDTAYVFESYVGHESRPEFPAREQRGAIRAGRHVSRSHPRFLNCTHYQLNRVVPELESSVLDILQRNPVSSEKSLSVDDLAGILLMTAGIRSPQTAAKPVQRWAATGGNLGSVQLFVSIRRVNGLRPGFYFYQPNEHSLAHFQRRGGALAVENFMERVISPKNSDLPDAMVLFTGAYGRVSQKYGVFGYRLINLDAGAALSQLHLVAKSLNICSHVATRWADDLIADQLNLDPILEQVTVVASLSRKCAAADLCNKPSAPGPPPSAKPPEYFEGISLPTIFEMVFRDSRIDERELGRTPFAVPPELLKVVPRHGLTVALPAPARGGLRVGNILTGRASIRRYTADPVRADQLSTMLHCAIHGDRNDWPQEHRAGRDLTLLALAWNVEGLGPGVYEYVPEDHSLALLPVSASATNAAELFVQNEFAAAPLIVWIAGNLAAACAAHGAFGHRQLLLRGGTAAHRLWMAALARGLAGTIVAGVVPGAARRFLHLDGDQRASLVAFATGYAPAPRGLRAAHDPITTNSWGSI